MQQDINRMTNFVAVAVLLSLSALAPGATAARDLKQVGGQVAMADVRGMPLSRLICIAWGVTCAV